MKLTFPKIVHKIDLGEYDTAMQGQLVEVWVNPPSEHLVRMGELNNKLVDDPTEEARQQYVELLSDLLSQGDKSTHFNAHDLEELITGTADTDPRFWVWFQVRIINEINAHRVGLKKA